MTSRSLVSMPNFVNSLFLKYSVCVNCSYVLISDGVESYYTVITVSYWLEFDPVYYLGLVKNNCFYVYDS